MRLAHRPARELAIAIALIACGGCATSVSLDQASGATGGASGDGFDANRWAGRFDDFTGSWLAVAPAQAWEIREEPAAGNAISLEMRLSRRSTGGGGEALAVFRERARKRAAEAGASGFVIVSFTEGIDSSGPHAQRIARGVVELTR